MDYKATNVADKWIHKYLTNYGLKDIQFNFNEITFKGLRKDIEIVKNELQNPYTVSKELAFLKSVVIKFQFDTVFFITSKLY